MWEENDRIEINEDASVVDAFNENIIPKEGEFDISPSTYSKIFDTDFCWMVPYIIDFKKYKEMVETDIKSEADNITITLHTSIWNCGCSWDEHEVTCTIYIWGENGEGHDCFFYDGTRKNIVDILKKEIKKITDCIIEPDKLGIHKRINEEIKTVGECNLRIATLEEICHTN